MSSPETPQSSVPEAPKAWSELSPEEKTQRAWEVIAGDAENTKVPTLARLLGIEFKDARESLEELERQGKVGPSRGIKAREILENSEEDIAQQPLVPGQISTAEANPPQEPVIENPEPEPDIAQQPIIPGSATAPEKPKTPELSDTTYKALLTAVANSLRGENRKITLENIKEKMQEDTDPGVFNEDRTQKALAALVSEGAFEEEGGVYDFSKSKIEVLPPIPEEELKVDEVAPEESVPFTEPTPAEGLSPEDQAAIDEIFANIGAVATPQEPDTKEPEPDIAQQPIIPGSATIPPKPPEAPPTPPPPPSKPTAPTGAPKPPEAPAPALDPAAQKAYIASVRESFAGTVPPLDTFTVQAAVDNPVFIKFLEQCGTEFSGNIDPAETKRLQSFYETLVRRNEVREKLRKLYAGQISERFAVRLGAKDLAHVDSYLYDLAANTPDKLEDLAQKVSTYEVSEQELKAVREAMAQKDIQISLKDRATTERDKARERVDEKETLNGLKKDLQFLLKEAGRWGITRAIRGKEKRAAALENVSEEFGRFRRPFTQRSINRLRRSLASVEAKIKNMPATQKALEEAQARADAALDEVEKINQLELAQGDLQKDLEVIQGDLLSTAGLFEKSLKVAEGYVKEEIEGLIDSASAKGSIVDPEELLRLRERVEAKVAGLGGDNALSIEYQDKILDALHEAVERKLDSFRFGDRNKAPRDRFIEQVKEYGPEGIDVVTDLLDDFIAEEVDVIKKADMKLMRALIRSTAK